jgi:hypothetical protein
LIEPASEHSNPAQFKAFPNLVKGAVYKKALVKKRTFRLHRKGVPRRPDRQGSI